MKAKSNRGIYILVLFLLIIIQLNTKSINLSH